MIPDTRDQSARLLGAMRVTPDMPVPAIQALLRAYREACRYVDLDEVTGLLPTADHRRMNPNQLAQDQLEHEWNTLAWV